MKKNKICILIPCYNEEHTIGSVVKKFKKILPNAIVYVYDNNSKDRTADVARKSGAVVKFIPRQGKGNVVRRMFADIEADLYIMIDGDDTYDVQSVKKMIECLSSDNLDMVVATRVPVDGSS